MTRWPVAGLGKTTLAHTVARHCGYRPVEINASDDRTGGALHTRITDACQMQAVMGARQPNCVIIDEIDGAAGKDPPPPPLAPLQTRPGLDHSWWRGAAGGGGGGLCYFALLHWITHGYSGSLSVQLRYQRPGQLGDCWGPPPPPPFSHTIGLLMMYGGCMLLQLHDHKPDTWIAVAPPPPRAALRIPGWNHLCLLELQK